MTYILHKTILFPTLLLCLSLTTLRAQFEVNNNALDLGSSEFRLTEDLANQNGSIWYKLQHDFSTDLNVEGQFFFGNDDPGADGIVFVIQNNCLAAGGVGSGIGYGGITGASLGVEFDTYQNIMGTGAEDNTDPSYDHIALHRDGNVDHVHANNLLGPVQMHNTKLDVEDSLWYDFRVFYDASANQIEVYFDGVLRFTYSIDIVNTIFSSDPYAYWGFTSATGGFSNEHRVRINTSSTTLALQDTSICTGPITIDALSPLTRYSGENLALGKTTNSSSNEGGGSGPPRSDEAVDGNFGTRWSSDFLDSQWVEIDLGGTLDIDSVHLYWEGAYATEYKIQTSVDGIVWTDQFHETAGDGGTDKIVFSAMDVSFVRMFGIQRATIYGFSLWEFEVYGTPQYLWSPDDGSISDIYSEGPTFSPTSTTTYTVAIPDPCNGSVDLDYTINVNCVLPFKEYQFESECMNSGVMLRWETSYPEEVDRFILQRSFDAVNFEDVVEIPFDGNTSYSYLDKNFVTKIVYYRFVELDHDGNVFQSYPVTSQCEGQNIYIGNHIFQKEIQFEVDENAWIRIFDVSGRLIYFSQGERSLRFGQNVARGLYIIQVISPDYGQQIFRLEKK